MTDVLAGAGAARYEIVRKIGEGASARVYLGVDRTSRSPVAVKVLRPELAATVSLSRFRREIGYLQTLRHSNILPILDASLDGDTPFLVMPYADGATLRERLIERRQLPLAEALRIAGEIALGLDHAHSHNIVHRDLKPANVLFVGDRTMIGDFGIARAIVASASEEKLSSSGIVVGTPDYMSPEQLFAEATVDGRCDVYALACVTYEMLVGEPPFTGATPISVAVQHAVRAMRPVRSVRPDVPGSVETAIRCALAKDADQRPATAVAFYEQLEHPSS
jgi:serine/threonine-protein kinase